MSSTPSRSGSRSEVLTALREWLVEADRIAYEQGGTWPKVLAEALENLEEKEADALSEPSP